MKAADITICFTENGYIIQQRKRGYDFINEWVAESEKTLLGVISDVVRKHWEDIAIEKKSKEISS